jgi:putative oxidoreductase
MRTTDRLLLFAALLTGVVAVLHVAIIFGGAEWYRFFGAGERMARLAARGSFYPALVTAVIAIGLGVWTLYALSGAHVIGTLPLTRVVLGLIAAVFLARGVLGIPVVAFVDSPYTVELRSRMTFMLVTSALCVCLGLCYAVGAVRYDETALRAHARE